MTSGVWLSGFLADPEFGAQAWWRRDIEGERRRRASGRRRRAASWPMTRRACSVSPQGGESDKCEFAGGGDFRGAGEVGGFLEGDAGDELSGAEQGGAGVRACGPAASRSRGCKPCAQAECGGDADRLAAVGAGGHDAGAGEGDVGGADDAAGEHQVGDVAAVHAAPRDLIDALGVPLGAAGLGAENAVHRVEVDGPAAEGDGVGVDALFDDVLLDEDADRPRSGGFRVCRGWCRPIRA